MARTPLPVPAYEDLSPTPGHSLTKGKPTADWFGSGEGEGYVQALVARFEQRHPDAAKELRFIANEAKWSTGWRGLGHMIEEEL